MFLCIHVKNTKLLKVSNFNRLHCFWSQTKKQSSLNTYSDPTVCVVVALVSFVPWQADLNCPQPNQFVKKETHTNNTAAVRKYSLYFITLVTSLAWPQSSCLWMSLTIITKAIILLRNRNILTSLILTQSVISDGYAAFTLTFEGSDPHCTAVTPPLAKSTPLSYLHLQN